MATLEVSKYCPLIKEDCKQLGCSWFTQVRGTHPQTGAAVDEWGCAITWMPVLSINTAQEVRQGAAATESFRNAVMGEMRTAAPDSAAAAVTVASTRVLENNGGQP